MTTHIIVVCEFCPHPLPAEILLKEIVQYRVYYNAVELDLHTSRQLVVGRFSSGARSGRS
jgi:hypothetical protein